VPNVSVCIPTYNREHLLKETLDSVVAQTYRDFEVVIVDDGSTDGTKQMLEKHGFNVRYYWQKNSGDAAARNKLIALAQGKYISFLDSDDLLFPDAMEEMVRAMPKDAEDVIVYGPYVAIDENGNILHRRKKKLYSGRITTNLFENILIHSCGSLFPKKILVEQNGFDTSMPVCSDYDLWLKLSLKYGFIGIDKPVFKRRRHSGNISKICFANRNIEYKVLEKFYYSGGGKDVVPHRLAMKRLGKEQYRAARSAIRESIGQTACDYLKDSLRRQFNLKTLLWLFIAKAKLHPALWVQPAGDKQSAIAGRKIKSISDIRIAIDLDPVLVSKYSGFYTFGTGLLEGLSQLEEKPELILFHSSKYVKETEQLVNFELSKIAELKTLAVKMRWLESFWNRFNYPKLEEITGDFDIYHCFHHLMPPTKAKPRLMTVYDLRRYRLPQLYKKSKLGFFETAVKKAGHFLAISQATKQDLCSIFGINKNKVDVISLASGIEPVVYLPEKKIKIKTELVKHLGRELKDYFVVISSPDSRKNVRRTVEAFEAAAKYIPDDMKLVIVGNLDKRDYELGKKLKANLYRNVVWAGTVEDLRPWLACSRALIFASLYEGFGIPILEAFSCGTAVITSDCSSMPEVGGDAALYVDPFDTALISQAIVKIANDENLRNSLVAAGRERNKLFTWKRTAQEVVAVYKKLAGI
jgi:glycosyltransferase involved in cell wall biosynthesis